jgi:hypothetical protein
MPASMDTFLQDVRFTVRTLLKKPLMSERAGEAGKLSLLELYDLKEQARLFEDFASARNTQYNVTGDGPPEALMATVATYNLFDLLGTKPLLGATWPQSSAWRRRWP